ncbi:hypothetical protein QQF64_032778 [Cirrhinus molitorella]|uniref:Uncharacterized protein n=1 Tax=Cirrhinus molitorella TaxID=172907 RepID=A0ABR3MS64_9TELE
MNYETLLSDSLGNFVSLHGHLYCQPHYKQLFKSKGNFEDGFGQGSQRELLAVQDTDHNSLDWRYSLSQSSVCSLSDVFEKEANQSPNKISVVWPPQTASPKKTLSLDQDVKLVKPVWPPKSETSKSPKYQRRKATQRTTL